MMSAGRRLAGLTAAALDRGLGPRARGRIALLTYHRVAPLARGGAQPPLNVTPTSFVRQLDGLLRAGAVIAPLSAALDPAFEGGRRAPTFVLTFDDGYAGVCEVAWPRLRERGVPATVFVASAYVGAAEPFPFDAWGRRHRQDAPPSTWRPLSIAECAGMLEGGLVDIGSHTHTHADFRGRPDAFEADVRASVAWLDDHFGPGARPFAFPYGRRHAGHHDGEMMARARRAGVTCALTTDGAPVDPRHDAFGWGRFTVYDWDTAATLLARLHGWYHWSHRVQEWLASRPTLRAAVRS